MAKTRANEKAKSKLQVQLGASPKEHTKLVDKEDVDKYYKEEMEAYDDLYEDAETNKKDVPKYIQYLKEQEKFQKQYADQLTVADFTRETADIIGDNSFLAATLGNGERILMMAWAEKIESKNINVDRVCHGPPEEGHTVRVGKTAMNPAMTQDAVLLIPSIIPYTDCTVEQIGPGWQDNTFRLFYKQYGAGEINYPSDEKAFGTPGALLDDFWIRYEPSKFRGLVICAPNPYDLIMFKWESGSQASLGVVLLALIGFILLIVKKFAKGFEKILPFSITGPKTRSKAKLD